MKKIILAILLSGVFITVNAQTEKGDWIVGGRIDLNTSDNNTHIGFSPNGAYFLINNLAIGGNLMIDYSKSGDNKVTNLGIGPFARYYFTQAMARPLLQASVDYISRQIKDPIFSSTNNGVNIFIAGGLAVFINENVAIEVLAGYSNTKYKGFDGSGGFNLGIGFQVYLKKGQVDRLRGN
jgi:outer membrane protein